MTGPAPATAYDTYAYPGFAYPQTHPDRLALHARLFGMDPAPPGACRVLELGCGDGGNLVPMAVALPGSQFVGVDLAATAVQRGSALVAQLGLANAELRRGDLAALPGDLGTFDYIVAHGVYSWVPDAAREGLMRAFGDLLAPQGVAYVSYNAYPGAHLREMTREIMRFHVRGIADPAERVREARSLMEALIAVDAQSAYGRVLREQAGRLLDQHDWLLLHDDLAEVNRAFWFHEVAAHAARHGLQFLAEADLYESRVEDIPQQAADTLERAAGDVVLREQYLDFVRNRVFRQTLLCRAGVALERAVGPGSVAGLAVSAYVRTPGAVDLARDVPVRFEGPREATLTTGDPLVKAALAELAALWPAAIRFEELLACARARAGSRGDADLIVLGDVLLRAYLGGIVLLGVEPPPVASAAGERPVASPLARLQAARGGEVVTSLRHTTVQVEDATARRLLALLDGTRDRAALLADLGEGPDAAGQLDEALDRLAELGVLAG